MVLGVNRISMIRMIGPNEVPQHPENGIIEMLGEGPSHPLVSVAEVLECGRDCLWAKRGKPVPGDSRPPALQVRRPGRLVGCFCFHVAHLY
jgi:hypothetical protein